MDEQQIEVVEWIPQERAEGLPESIGWLGGFFQNGMRWPDYVEHVEDFKRMQYVDALRRAILKDKLVIVGDEHQVEKRPLFSDGTTALFSMRAWGDLMAAIYSELEGQDYCYMDFYMQPTCPKLNGSMPGGQLPDGTKLG